MQQLGKLLQKGCDSQCSNCGRKYETGTDQDLDVVEDAFTTETPESIADKTGRRGKFRSCLKWHNKLETGQ